MWRRESQKTHLQFPRFLISLAPWTQTCWYKEGSWKLAFHQQLFFFWVYDQHIFGFESLWWAITYSPTSKAAPSLREGQVFVGASCNSGLWYCLHTSQYQLAFISVHSRSVQNHFSSWWREKERVHIFQVRTGLHILWQFAIYFSDLRSNMVIGQYWSSSCSSVDCILVLLGGASQF